MSATGREILDRCGAVVKANHDRIFQNQAQVVTNGPLRQVADAPTSKAIRSRAAGTAAPREVGEVFEEELKILLWRERADHARNFIRPSPTFPLGFPGDMLAVSANPEASMWESASGPTSVEVGLVDWFKDQFGLPGVGGGVLVSGGSEASRKAYQAARAWLKPESLWLDSIVYVSEVAYGHQLGRLQAIGIPKKSVRAVRVDGFHRMDPGDLFQKIDRDIDNNQRPFLVIASVGNPQYLGGIDDLETIASHCQTFKLWLHVDGEYAGPLALHKENEAIRRGIKTANSISLDGSNWLKQGADCGILLVDDKWKLAKCFGDRPAMKEEARALGFSKARDYIRSNRKPNLLHLGSDHSSPARAMRLSSTMKVLGHEAIRADIAKGVELANMAETALRLKNIRMDQPHWKDWNLLLTPRIGFLVFRFQPKDTDPRKIQTLNKVIVGKAAAEKVAFMAIVKMQGKFCIRMCTGNPYLTNNEMDQIIRDIDRIARAVDPNKLQDGPDEDEATEDEDDDSEDGDTGDSEGGF
ncbi:MAG: hypothetical protein M1831_001728 [Alyxoria varia]|nr:MAG: hypothetical protein M1831_001728 [Alyxoria varia]